MDDAPLTVEALRLRVCIGAPRFRGREAGWARPEGAHRWHYFDRRRALSLCEVWVDHMAERRERPTENEGEYCKPCVHALGTL